MAATLPPPTKPPATIKPPTAVAKPAGMPPKPTSPKGTPRQVKTFSIKPWADTHEGEKILIYGKSGIGKTSIAAMAPNPVFIGLDDGGRKIPHPQTGVPVNSIPGIVSFDDIRDALHQNNLFPDSSTIVIDTITKLESVMEPYIFENYKQSGKTVTAMRQYGWDGPAHLLDVERLLLSDLEEHVRKGRNILLLAQLSQITVANAEGADYLEDGPKLQHNKQYSGRTEFCEWSDHVLRIGYQNFNVAKDNDKSRVAKVVESDATRAIFTGGAQHFIAKSRPVKGNRLPPVISFDAAADDSLWTFMFKGGEA